jgi:NIPSNAP
VNYVLYELRLYSVTPGRLGEVIDNAVRFAIPLQKEHGFDHVGFWTVSGEEAGRDTDLVYLLRWESLADRDSKWRSFTSDSRWTQRQAETGAETPLVMSERIQFLEPTQFSNLQ